MEILENVVVGYADMLITRRENMRIKKWLRDNSNPFGIGDNVFFKHYRMYPHLAVELINTLTPFLDDHPCGVPPYLQVLSTIRFLAEGPYQKGLGTDYHCPISQTSVSRYLHKTIPAFLRLTTDYIKFPKTAAERQEISQSFQQTIGFPGVLGIVDCTLIEIITPAEHEEAYLDYKRNHSLNVQIVCDHQQFITDVRICSGSTTDQTIWLWSDLRFHLYQLLTNQQIRENEGSYFIIGDGGYNLSRVLMLPIQDTIPGSPERAFSDAVRTERSKVECLNGMLKQKIRILGGLRGIHYHPLFAAAITLAGITLFSYMRHHGMPLEQGVAEDHNIQENGEINIEDFHNHEEYLQGLEGRQWIVNNHFA